MAGYEDVNDSERLSQIRPSGRDAVMKETKRFVGVDVAKAQLDVAIGPNGESCWGLRGYGRVPGRARLGFIRSLGAELPGRLCTPARAGRFARGCRRRRPRRHASSPPRVRDNVCGANRRWSSSNRRSPRLVADPLTDLVARMPNRANVDRRVTCARQVAGHVRSDVRVEAPRPPAKRSPAAPSGHSRSRPPVGAHRSFGSRRWLRPMSWE